MFFLRLFAIVLFALACISSPPSAGEPAEKAKASGIMEAAWSNDVERLKKLLSADATLVRARGDGNWTPLHHAAFHGHKDAVLVLLAYGADLSAKATAHKKINGIDAKNETPEHFAAKNRKEMMAKFLADVRKMDSPEREELLAKYRAQEERPKPKALEPTGDEKKHLADLQAILQIVLDVDAEAILQATAKIHEGTKGTDLADMVRLVRLKIAPAIEPILKNWPTAERHLLAKEIESGIVGANGEVLNRIDRKLIGKAISAVASRCRDEIDAAEKAVEKAVAAREEAEASAAEREQAKKRAEAIEAKRAATPYLIDNVVWEKRGRTRYLSAKITNNTGMHLRYFRLKVRLYAEDGSRCGSDSDSIDDWKHGEVWNYLVEIPDDRVVRAEFGDNDALTK
jgi:hypothetical protein